MITAIEWFEKIEGQTVTILISDNYFTGKVLSFLRQEYIILSFDDETEGFFPWDNIDYVFLTKNKNERVSRTKI